VVDDFSAEIVGTEQSGSSGGESHPVRQHGGQPRPAILRGGTRQPHRRPGGGDQW
jgi:hypothetical protein